MAHNTVWGLDIGNSAIKAVKMIRMGNDARIVDIDIIDIEGGDEDSDRSARVRSALGTLVRSHEFRKDPVYLSLPGNLCLVREFVLPAGSESKLNELVVYEAKQQIPFPLEQVEMGWERFEPSGEPGIGVELIAVRKNIIEEILSQMDEFKLNVQGITVSPVALFNFIHYEYRPTETTIILDAGYKGTDFVAMRGRHLYSRTIPTAGREITRILENKFKVPYARAEEIKKNLDQSKQKQKVLSVIEPTLRLLGAEIQRTIGYYKSKAKGGKIDKAYLLGHTFRLPTMAEHLATQVGDAPCVIVEGVQRISLDRSVNPAVFANEFPTMAVAIGLGVQGLGIGELNINLLPMDRKTELRIGEQRLWAGIAAAALLISLLVSYYSANRQKEYLVGVRDRMKKEMDEVKALQKKVDDAVKTLDEPRHRLERLIRIGRDRGRMNEIYGQVSNLKRPNDNRPLFGSDNIYLTNLYVSRDPILLDRLSLPAGKSAIEAGDKLSNGRLEILRNSANISGAKSLYAPLREIVDPDAFVPELQPDVPLVVVLSGECPQNNALDAIATIANALKALPQIKEVRTNDYRQGFVHKEYVANLDWLGLPVEGKPLHQAALEIPYTAFHISFQWVTDDEIDPQAVAEEQKKKLEEAQAKATPKKKS